MKTKLWAGLAAALIILSMAGIVGATTITSTTGDLGNNVIFSAGDFSTTLDAVTPSSTAPSSLVVKYGLWNSPSVTVQTYFDGILLGTFDATSGYISPGPQTITFDITGLVLDGANTILFSGLGYSGDYVIGQVDMIYDNSGAPVPEPGTVTLLGLGIAGLAFYRKRHNSKA